MAWIWGFEERPPQVPRDFRPRKNHHLFDVFDSSRIDAEVVENQLTEVEGSSECPICPLSLSKTCKPPPKEMELPQLLTPEEKPSQDTLKMFTIHLRCTLFLNTSWRDSFTYFEIFKRLGKFCFHVVFIFPKLALGTKMSWGPNRSRARI